MGGNFISKQLFTIGYEGNDIDFFVSRLKRNDIDYLLDIRQVPLSRKQGFSKSVLARRLNQDNIRYIHFRELGSPKHLRDKLKATNDYWGFFQKMDVYLTRKKEVIEEVHSYVVSNTCCLMCFERMATQCHRKLVADKIKEYNGNGLKIINI